MLSKEFKLISEFFSNSIKVKNIVEGALLYGGATSFYNNSYSNIKVNDELDIRGDKNIIRLFIPSTIEYSTQINNIEYVRRYFMEIRNKYLLEDINLISARGSFKENEENIIYEDVTLIEVEFKEITKGDIDFFLNLANRVKNEMTQYCVSVSINDSLALV